MLCSIALILGAYLLGSLPYMILLGRARGFDLSQEEDLHIALYRKVGRIEGISGVIVDILKGIIPIVVGFIFGFKLPVIVTAGVAGAIGQMWPIFNKFDGEKGNSAGAGIIITLSMELTNSGYPLAYLVFLIALIPGIIGFLVRTIPRVMATGQTSKERTVFGGPVSNSLPLGMIIGFAVAPLVSWFLKLPIEVTMGLLALFILIVLRRLTARLGQDLKTANTSTRSILINRLLYDRSYL